MAPRERQNRSEEETNWRTLEDQLEDDTRMRQTMDNSESDATNSSDERVWIDTDDDAEMGLEVLDSDQEMEAKEEKKKKLQEEEERGQMRQDRRELAGFKADNIKKQS